MKGFKPLAREFFKPSADVVAPRLLGHLLLRRTSQGLSGGPIVETEAYLWDDAACHAAAGITTRNRVMFGPPGHAYVYFIYGMHHCVNAVCRPAGTGEAVLIRALEPAVGPDILQRHRRATSPADLTNGPAKLCQAMQIYRELDGADLCDASSALFVAKNDSLQAFRAERGKAIVARRIGITKAAHLPLRFYLPGSLWVSRPVPSR
jgi:DNA-3-methyladenine glycosylase